MTDIDALIERLRNRKIWFDSPDATPWYDKLALEAADALAKLRDYAMQLEADAIRDAKASLAQLDKDKAEIAKLRSECIKLKQELGGVYDELHLQARAGP